jgi:peptidoglycan hydrolase-like protein with peptidoglycan-binding domain
MSGGIGSVGAGAGTGGAAGVDSTPDAGTARTATPSAPPAVLKSERFGGDATLLAVSRGERTLEVGAREKTAVKRLQLALIECGVSVGSAGADGAFGRGTQSGISAFQRGAGLTASGKLDAATLAALDAKVYAIDHPKGAATTAAALDAGRFKNDAVLSAIARGERTLARGAKGDDVQKLQLTLQGLGYALPRYGADKGFGAETESALKRFQRDQGLTQSGKLDRTTLLALDEAAAAKVKELVAVGTAPEEKPLRYRVVADLVGCRNYVIDIASEKPVAVYLTSPGTAEFPTRGNSFTLQGTRVMSPWTPPPSPWAEGLPVAPPGLENPMGILKLSFGAYAQYFHGIPKHEEKDLGKPASHGCLRMSTANVLEFHEKYAGPGTKVTLTRDAAESERLAQAAAAAGLEDRPITAGIEYVAPYFYDEMGKNQTPGRDGRVTIGGRG